MLIKAYTDGACSNNPGSGGYSSIILAQNKNYILCGYKNKTTNNEMELLAFCKTLQFISGISAVSKIKLFSDSAYVVNSINLGWLENWKKNRYINGKGEKIKNLDIWLEIEKYLEYFEVSRIELAIIKIKGHSGNRNNELADKAAKAARDKKLEFVKEFTSSERLELTSNGNWH